jgi:hypothetical protein
MATLAGQMTTSPPADPQWVPCNGKYYYGYAPLPAPPRPHAGVSTGTYRDFDRNCGSWGRSRGIGGWLIGVPYDPGATYSVSLADDSVETALVTPPTVQKPPAGIK